MYHLNSWKSLAYELIHLLCTLYLEFAVQGREHDSVELGPSCLHNEEEL